MFLLFSNQNQFMKLMFHMKQQHLVWAVFGVLILFSVQRMVFWGQKLAIRVEQSHYQNIKICKTQSILHSVHIERLAKFWFYPFSFDFSGDHVECVSLDYDPKKISYQQLLNLFWNNHEYGKRLKRQYTSLILYHNEKQMTEALASLEREKAKFSAGIIYTEIAAAGTFYPAEE